MDAKGKTGHFISAAADVSPLILKNQSQLTLAATNGKSLPIGGG